MGRVRALNFYATERHHTPTWILKKIADLVDKGKRHEDSSSILYACLEARNLLEMISTTKLLCSVSDEDRARITAAVKPQNGIKGVNKELKALGLKTQEFMNAVCAVENQEFPVFNFTESDDIQHRLSQYIHTLISTLLRRKVIILRIEERFHQFDRILDDCHRFLGHLFECFAIFSDSIGQLYSFQVGPNEFIGIEFGGIRRDARDPQPFPCFGTQKGTGFIRFMPARIVPNQ